MKNSICNIPNILTAFRIFGAVGLVFIDPIVHLNAFISLYGFCGLSDLLDGTIARKTGTASELGAKLDSIADISLLSVVIIKLLPIIAKKISRNIIYWAMAVIFVRILSYVAAAVKYKRFASLHTYMNKATGFSIFMVPFMMYFNSLFAAWCILVCIISSISSTEELILHLTSNGYDPSRKTILRLASSKKEEDRGGV